MNKTKIEWVRNEDGTQGYTINPVKGKCPMACPYCYARRMYDRFKWNPELKFVSRWWAPLTDLKLKPSRIFVGSTMELFGDWIQSAWINDIFEIINTFSFFTFILLTKQPQNLVKWSPFPANCWVGESIIEDRSFIDILNIDARVRFISFEPLRSHIDMSRHSLKGISWVIIGQQTPIRASTTPRIEWIREIVEAADKASVPVFLKNNLMPLLKGVVGVNAPYWKHVFPFYSCLATLRQEFPKEVEG